MYSNKEVGELLGSVAVGVVKLSWHGAKFGVALHFILKYW